MAIDSHRGSYGQVLIERMAFLGAVVTSFAALGCGWYLAQRLGDSHWMNRAGAAVVSIQVIAGAAEFARRKRLQHLQRRTQAQEALRAGHTQDLSLKMRGFLEEEVAKSEMQALTVVLFLAVLGEIFHGFGDLIFELMF